MKFKNYICTCKSEDFDVIKKGINFWGLYCTKCGRFYKWLNKGERNIYIINSQKESEENKNDNR